MNFTKAFRTGVYKKHREDVLLDREIAILPTRQARVEATLKLRDAKGDMDTMSKELAVIDLKRQQVFIKMRGVQNKMIRYTAESEGRAPPAYTLTEGEKAGTPERAKFIMKCPDGDCRGFLSTAYKCGTCQKWACSDCLVVKGLDKDTPHTCEPGQKETVALIIKESKPCPKCGQRISKIDGCFARDTPVLLWNGTSKMSQDIVVGDTLVGDDGTMRTVQTTCAGEDEMYAVTQNRGIPYTVNSKHTLVLSKDTAIVEILVDTFLTFSPEEQSTYKGIKKESHGFSETDITIRAVGRGQYYGWTIDKNHRFLLNDTTVQRNCDQMWCTDCHTAFSWTTGNLVNGVVHNPHYYEFLRKEGNGVAPRNAGDVECGGVPYYLHIQRAVRALPAGSQNVVMRVHRITSEIADQRLQNFQGHFNVNDNGDLAVKYLMKEIDRDAMKVELAKREVKRNKHLAIRAILEMFVTTSTMILTNIVNNPPENSIDAVEYAGMLPAEKQAAADRVFRATVTELKNLRTYVNESLLHVSRMKACSVPQIAENWNWVPFAKVQPKKRVARATDDTDAAPAPAPVPTGPAPAPVPTGPVPAPVPTGPV
jgi:hypothetical protein